MALTGSVKKYGQLLLILLFFCSPGDAQKTFFIDGYHGGVFGHYPVWYTGFINTTLAKNPFWKINLEIEPETWDSVKVREPEALLELQKQFADQSLNGRIEYVNPSYGQSYLFNISGESIIRQFEYGIKKVKQYFPTAVFTTYSTEEPCFTSALPQLLRSFGFKYASLKNPNTCWGGYMRAYGGELVNWIGPDGSSILTVPRYKVEALEPRSTWQTIAWTNSEKYITAAREDGIKNPVGMCLQDAGWRNGPWLGDPAKRKFVTEYKTWREYIENNSAGSTTDNYRLSQEDVLVSLVWGAQVLQRIAQEVRVAENNIVMAEKLSTIANIYKQVPVSNSLIDEAWRTLLLAQHHDCWIVPYNGRRGDRWIEKVARWTTVTDSTSAAIMQQAMNGWKAGEMNPVPKTIRVFNTLLNDRSEWVSVPVMDQLLSVVDDNNKPVPSQLLENKTGGRQLLLKATVPSLGYTTYTLQQKPAPAVKGAALTRLPDGKLRIETDLYRIVIDPQHGGSIQSIIAKKLGNKEFVSTKQGRYFNEARGNFYDNGGFHATSDSMAKLTVMDSGSARIRIKVEGYLSGHPFTQTLTTTQSDPVIDLQLLIDWKNNIGIGESNKNRPSADDRWKAFYDDSKKLALLFPLNLEKQKVYKNAPFDVTESRLANTFFTRWDSIKNNIILNWVDVCDGDKKFGMALFTDHTTSYTHGEDFPLGLTVQYSGGGLWGRDYRIEGPTRIHYALVPHAGTWKEAGISTQSASWNEPLQASVYNEPGIEKRSLVTVATKGWQATTATINNNEMLIRIFNAEGDDKKHSVTIDAGAGEVSLVELNGDTKEKITVHKNSQGQTVFELAIPLFGMRTIKLSGLLRKDI